MNDGLIRVRTKMYWSRVPGKFVNKLTGEALDVRVNDTPVGIGPKFTGTLREWYETLVETIIDVYNRTPEPSNAIYAGRDVANMLECTVLFRPKLNVNHFPSGDTLYPDGIAMIGMLVNRAVYLDLSLGTSIMIGHHNGGSWCEGEVEVLDLNII